MRATRGTSLAALAALRLLHESMVAGDHTMSAVAGEYEGERGILVACRGDVAVELDLFVQNHGALAQEVPTRVMRAWYEESLKAENTTENLGA